MRTRWDTMPRRVKRPGMLAGGDGSTLSLDFTAMSSLDSRFTFTRASTATFINSSGLVQDAGANMVVNADFVGAGTGNAPTSWTGSTGINLSIPATGVRRAETTTAAQNWIASPNFTTNNGLTYSTSVQLNAVSGQHYSNTMLITGSPTLVGYYLNGSSVGQFATAQPGLLTIVWTATGTHGVRIGIGSTGANVASAVCEFTQPRTVPGNFAQPAYFANSSTTAAYHAPRFDYDPTTLAPRGLLIEGSATNLVTQSSAMNNWTFTRTTASTPSVTAPDGASTSVLVTGTADVNNHLVQNANSISFTPQNYTFSVWLKAGATNFAQLSFTNSVGFPTNTYVNVDLSNGTLPTVGGSGATATISTAYPNGWYRVTLTATHTGSASHTGSCLIYLVSSSTAARAESWDASSASVYVFGAQLEAGAGASSYIPTGSSTVQRAADDLQLTGSNFSSIWPSGLSEWSVYWSGDITRAPATTQFVWLTRAGGSSRTRGFITTGSSIRSSNNIADLIPGLNATVNTVFKMATGFKNVDCFMWAHNGTTTASAAETSSGLQTDSDRLLFNVNSDNFMHIRQFKFWQSRLSNGTLQGLVS